MSFLLRTNIRIASDSLRHSRTRSFLTALGIGIGIAAIVLILSLAGAINRLIRNEVSTTGADLVIVRPSSSKDLISNVIDELTSANQYLRSTLTFTDATTIASLEQVSAAAPLAVSESTLSAGNTNVSSATVVATTQSLADILDLPLHSGNFLTSTSSLPTAVIGNNLSNQLFGSGDSLTKTLTYNGTKYIIVGTLERADNPLNFTNIDFDNALIIDSDFATTVDPALQVQQIVARSRSATHISTTTSLITSTLRDAKNGEQNFTVMSGDKITHPAGSIFSIITSMLTLVAGISLIVGGIGIMNIMLVSVSERTHEIGIRKAVGASSGNILSQFLFESLILSIMGCFIGLILGYALTFLISLVTPFAPFISLEILGITFGVALATGVLFGIYPALKASRKNPIESLKHYR